MQIGFVHAGSTVAVESLDKLPVAIQIYDRQVGEFAGALDLAGGQLQKRTRIDAGCVERVVLQGGGKPRVEVHVSIEPAIADYPDAAGSDFKFLLRYDLKRGRWRVESLALPWMNEDEVEIREISADIGDWLSKEERRSLRLTDTFPFARFGICDKKPNGLRPFLHMHAGLFAFDAARASDDDQEIAALSFVCVPVANEPEKIKAHTFGALLLKRVGAGMTSAVLSAIDHLPVILVCDLAPLASRPEDRESRWLAIVQWRAQGCDGKQLPTHLKRADATLVLDSSWNALVERASVGRKQTDAGQPWWPMPLVGGIAAEGDVRPLFAFRIPKVKSGSNRLMGIVFHCGPRAANPDATISFFWPPAESLAEKHKPEPLLVVKGKLVLKGIRGWSDESETKPKPERSLRVFATAAIDVSRFAHECLSRSDADLLATWTFKDISVTTDGSSWISLGSIDIKPKTSGAAPAQMELSVRGTWTADTCDIYPEMKLTGLPCLIRTSSGADVSRASLTAQFDVASRLEDELQRATAALIAPTTMSVGKELEETSGAFDVQLRTEPERNSLLQLRLRRDTTAQPATKPALYIQARPFTVARLHPPMFDQEAGTDFAYWRSDDTENSQWRVPDATVGFDLPPQTVAEEMERGSRFWQANDSYIDTKEPIKFRFSPPTRVVVRPSVTERRYNKSPNNLGEVLAHARVEAFQTELLYPIRMAFRRNEVDEPDIRIAELALFLGLPSPNLPGAVTYETEPLVRLVRDLLTGDLGQWAVRIEDMKQGPTKALLKLVAALTDLRNRHSASRAHFAARTAQYHVFDPYRRDRQLQLTQGLTARLRTATRPGAPSAPPLISPLPPGSDLSESQKTGAVLDFLTDRTETWGDPTDDGALRAGALHTIEFPSELAAVLRTPQARSALIDSLSFSTLGATGSASISFDEGRTTFSVEIQDGQVWRLRRVRIGRIGVVCNKAKHIIVYERTVLPSAQFISQQPENATYGYPILRKTEEYIEPIERVRAFADEPSATDNVTAFIGTSEFTSSRIYVDSAWGRDLGHGYELPLWNRNDTSGFYPKPFVCLGGHASQGEMTRAWHCNPDELYFYSNTQSGTGSDPDRWDMFSGVDLPAYGPVRLPLQTNAKLTSTEIVDRKTLAAPRLGATRRRRFDFEVQTEGPVNLQHSRGDTEMLAAVRVVSLARTSETKAIDTSKDALKKELKDLVDDNVENLRALTNYAADIDGSREAVRRFIEEIPGEWLRYGFDCTRLEATLQEKRKELFTDLRGRIESVGTHLPADKVLTPPNLKDVLAKELEGLAVYPAQMIREARTSVRGVLGEVVRLSDAQIDQERERLRRVTQSAWQLVSDSLEKAQKTLAGNLQAPLTLIDGAAQAIEQGCNELIEEVGKFADPLAVNLRQRAADVEACAKKVRAQLEAIKVPQFVSALRPVRGALLQVELTANEFQLSADGELTALRDEIRDALKVAAERAQTAANAIRALVKRLGVDAELATVFDALKTRRVEFDTKLVAAFDGTAAEVRGKVQELIKLLDGAAAQKIASLEDLYGKALEAIRTPLGAAAAALQVPVTQLYADTAKLAKALRDAVKKVLNITAAWLEASEETVKNAIGTIVAQCHDLGPVQKNIQDALDSVAKNIETRITNGIVSLVDEATAARVAQWDETFKDYANVGSRGLKLVKAIGDLPKLPQLKFNAEAGEYVFDDLAKQIETSPFAARLREIDSGLKELGLAVPARALLDQILPRQDQIDFNKVFRDLGGIDFRKLFKRFRLKQLESEHVKVQHGVDVATRSAWVRASVTMDSPEEQDLFALGPFAVKAAGMSLRALSDMRVSVDGARKATTTGSFTADWTLDMKGARLVTFRRVSAQFDGGKFNFNISPDNVDLHPSMRFISDVCKSVGEKIPPCIEVLRDARGVPSGAKASISAVLKDLPPLGPVKIGDLVLSGGLGLALEAGHGFVISTHFDVGSKTAPIFVQIGFLGGGAWLHAEARFIDGKVKYAANVGLALGSMQALNFAGVARGSYSFLMFAYAAIESEKGGSLRAGLSIQGSARLLGIVTAYIGLLLEVTHEGGKSSGRGVLDVEVEIGRWYSVHVCKAVEQKM